MRKNRQWMKVVAGGVLMMAVGYVMPRPAHGQTTAKQDMKNAGQNTKDAAKDTGNGVKKGTKKSVHATKRGTKKAYHKTKNTTQGAVDGAKAGAKDPQ
jgi:hypothetical protein